MNFNKEIKNTHDEILRLHDKFQLLNDNVSNKLDSLVIAISEKSIKTESTEESQLLNMKIFEEPKNNQININMQQPKLLHSILIIMIFLNICVTSAFLLK
jgi:hypothetical protein